MVESLAIVPVVIVEVASGCGGVWASGSVATDRNVLFDVQKNRR